MGLLSRANEWDYGADSAPAWRRLAFGAQPQQPRIPYSLEYLAQQQQQQQSAPTTAPAASPFTALQSPPHGTPQRAPAARSAPAPMTLPALTGTMAMPQLGFEYQDARFLPTTAQLAPGAVAMSAGGKESAPFDPNAPQFQPGARNGGWFANLGQRVEGLTDSRLFNLGLSLMGNAENGGNWRGVAEDLSAFGRDQRERQALENAERRQKSQYARESEQWTWAQAERARMSERRQMAEEYISSRPEAERAELRMIDPDQLGGYIQQQRQLDLQMQEMRENRAFRGASLALDRQRLDQDRILNSSMSVLGREEASRLGSDMQRLRGWSLIDNDMAALEEILERNPGAFNNLLDADVEQALARIRDPQTRRDVQTIYGIATSMAREELRGQTPVSNIDMLTAIRGAPSPSSGAAFARDWLNRAYQDRSDLEGYVQGAISYMQQPDGSRRSLFEPDPATGRNFYQSDTFRRYTRDDRGSFSDVRGRTGPGSDDAQAAAAELQRRQRAGAGVGHGNLGGAASAPRLLREPNAYEQTIIRQYEAASSRGQAERARVLETRLRQRGLIP